MVLSGNGQPRVLRDNQQIFLHASPKRYLLNVVVQGMGRRGRVHSAWRGQRGIVGSAARK